MSNLLVGVFGFDVLVTRFGQGVYVNGVYEDGVSQVIVTKMSIQPLTGVELVQRMQNQRNKTFFEYYSPIELKTASQKDGTAADIVIWNGVDYQVQSVQYHYSSAIAAISPYWSGILAGDNLDAN